MANTHWYTPVGPTGGKQGLQCLVPDTFFCTQRGVQDLEVEVTRYLTLLANGMLSATAQENALRRAVGPLFACNGGAVQSAQTGPDESIPALAGQYWLDLYDVRAALCELSRWLWGGGIGNRRSPEQAFALKRGQTTECEMETGNLQ